MEHEQIIEAIKSTFGQHPAYRLSFDELYKGVMDEVANGNLNRQVNGDLELFDYNIHCTFEKNWNVFTLISRGLILCPSQKKVVAAPLIKFMNFGEILYIPENEGFRATTKFDGSMGIVFWWNNQWNCSTRGSFKSDQAIWAKNWLDKNANTETLVPGRTYIFEIIYRENRIVITYDFEGLVLITGYDENGYEFLYEDTVEYAHQLNTRVVDAPVFTTIEEMIEKADKLSSNEEGWVVRFDNGYRLKIKGQEYCRIHKAISNCTPLAIWDLMRNCQDLEPLILELPEEFGRDIKLIRKLLQYKENELLHDILHAYQYTLFLSDKEIGLKMKELEQEYLIAAHFIFPCRKNNFLGEVMKPGKFRNSLWDKFRPTCNILEGFVPSTAMNRFSTEDN